MCSWSARRAAAAARARPKKIAGILTEMATEGDRVGHVVVGIGLNVNETALPPELAGRATSLALATGRAFDRIAGAGGGARRLSKIAYDDFRDAGPAAAVRRWAALRRDRRARRAFVSASTISKAWSLGIDPDGALRIAADDGRVHRVVSGEIT